MDPPIKFSGYRFGNTINFQCTDGYALSGPSFISCLSRRNKLMGHWSEQPPLCFGNNMFYNKQQEANKKGQSWFY